MNELNKYFTYKEKLQGICDENDLTFSIQNKRYPFYMTVKPISGIDAQMSMLEETESGGETGYISPDAVIVFAYKDGDLVYKMSETINISDALFNKIKNLFKKLHACWVQYYFRDRTESCVAGYEPVQGETETTDIDEVEIHTDLDDADVDADLGEIPSDPYADILGVE